MKNQKVYIYIYSVIFWEGSGYMYMYCVRSVKGIVYDSFGAHGMRRQVFQLSLQCGKRPPIRPKTLTLHQTKICDFLYLRWPIIEMNRYSVTKDKPNFKPSLPHNLVPRVLSYPSYARPPYFLSLLRVLYTPTEFSLVHHWSSVKS